MLEKFYPCIWVSSIYDIDFDELYKKGIRGLALDIDNTLITNQDIVPHEDLLNWVKKTQSIGMKLCIVSNGSLKRVEKFKKEILIDAIHKASKPSRKSFVRAAKLMNLPETSVAVIGDQIFTDILGGNRSGMLTILVNPINKKENIFIRFKRIFEKIILASYKFRNQSNRHKK